MSTSLLHHGWGLRGYHHVRHEFAEGRIVQVIEQPSWTLRCPACGSPNVIRSGQFERTFKAPPIGRTTVLIRLPIQRIECRDCMGDPSGSAPHRCVATIFDRPDPSQISR